MKKLMILCLTLVLVFSMAGCSSNSIKIEDYEWELSRVMILENELPVTIASNNDTEISDTTKKIDITLVAKDGVITITDKINDCTYSGTYKRTKTTPAGTDYEITIEGKEAHAGVAMTTYADGSQVPTLPISLGEYTLQLYAEVSKN